MYLLKSHRNARYLQEDVAAEVAVVLVDIKETEEAARVQVLVLETEIVDAQVAVVATVATLIAATNNKTFNINRIKIQRNVSFLCIF